MSRTIRTRTRTQHYVSGSVVLYTNGVAGTPSLNPNRDKLCSCTDSVGSPVVDSPFSSSQYSGDHPRVTGTVTATDTRYVTHYTDYSPTAMPLELQNVASDTPPAGWMLDLVAGTNPSRPVVNIPELAEDLWDLPRAIKNLGDLILNPANHAKPKGLAGEYLGVQFGWLPLIEDLQKLLEFQKYAIKRNKELHQLYSGKGLRRRLKFGESTTNTEVNQSLTAFPSGSVTLNSSVNVKKSKWATIHWYPTTLPPYHPDDPRWNDLATRLVLGWSPEAMLNGLWKIIPWTWLLGWFTNVGKYTLANSWTVPAQHGSGCFMSKAEGIWITSGVKSTNAFVKEHNLQFPGKGATKITRTRTVSSSVVAGANIPYLDMFRLSIIGALFVQRFSGKLPL